MARAIAERLGVGVTYVPFASPGEVADAVGSDRWDIALIADDPERAETIAFAAAYVEIEATYLVPQDSPLQSICSTRPWKMPVSGKARWCLPPPTWETSIGQRDCCLRRARSFHSRMVISAIESIRSTGGSGWPVTHTLYI